MPTTAVSAQKHLRSTAPYNANSFAEQNGVLVGKSARLRGFGVVSFVPNTTLTLDPGAFISHGLALNPTEPNRTAGIIAETTVNAVLDATGFLFSSDFYVFALANTPSEGTTVDFVIAASPAPVGQNAPLLRYVAGEFILEDALGADGLEVQVQTARVDAGAEQFFLTPNVGPTPRTVTISSANLPDGTLFPTDPAFPVGGLTASATNYIFYNTGVGALQFNTTGFPSSNALPLWEVTLNGSSYVTSKVDRRPFIGGGSGGGTANAVEVELLDICDDSVMQNYRISVISADAAPDVDTGTSTGTFLAPSEYELDNGELLESAFSGAALEAPASVSQVTVVVLVYQLLNPGDLTIEVSRDGGATYETAADNFVNHVFGAVPAGNNLQLRVTNASGGTIVVRGYGMYYNNIGGPTGVLGELEGVGVDSSGLNIFNRNVQYATVTRQAGVIAGQGVVRWRTAAAPTVSLTDEFEVLAPGLSVFARTPAGIVANNVAPGVVTNFVSGAPANYVFVDMNLAVHGATVALQMSAGPPPAYPGRVMLASRGAWGVYWWPDNLELQAADTNPLAEVLPAPYGFGVGVRDGLVNPSVVRAIPSAANPFATMTELSGVGGSAMLLGLLANGSTGSFAPPDAVSLMPGGVPYTHPLGTKRIRVDVSCWHTSAPASLQSALIDIDLQYGGGVGAVISNTFGTSAPSTQVPTAPPPYTAALPITATFAVTGLSWITGTVTLTTLDLVIHHTAATGAAIARGKIVYLG